MKAILDNQREELPGLGGLGSDNPASIYELIRNDILENRLAANERLKISALADRYQTSTNPIREALQQLRGEGFVTMSPNRGARVRPVEEEFVRDVYEMEVLIEPFLIRWFVGVCTNNDIARLEEMQAEMEALNFTDPRRHSELDTRFHYTIYEHHYNRHAVEMWWKHREILRAIQHGHPLSLKRQKEILEEHRGIIAALKDHDADRAASITHQHVTGAGHHLTKQMRAAKSRL